jgi:hypothetical protein
VLRAGNGYDQAIHPQLTMEAGRAETPDHEELERLFQFLGQIQHDQELREQLNWMQTAPEVSELAASRGVAFRAETLVDLLQRCNEAPYARTGLMDEKLIRLYLRRSSLLEADA